MIWKNGIGTCILLYLKQIASPGSMHETLCLGLVQWDNPEGWDAKGGVTLAALLGTKECAQCLEKPGTSVPGRPGLGRSPHFPTLAEFPRYCC